MTAFLSRLARLVSPVAVGVILVLPGVATAKDPDPSPEICDDGIDNDGDKLIDCADFGDCTTFLTCGEIQGGLPWVYAIYGLTLLVLIAYSLYVTRRLQSARSAKDSRDV